MFGMTEALGFKLNSLSSSTELITANSWLSVNGYTPLNLKFNEECGVLGLSKCPGHEGN